MYMSLMKNSSSRKPREPLSDHLSRGRHNFGQLPVLILDDGTQVSPSDAILRWAGVQGGLYPTDARQALQVDEVLSALDDVFSLYLPTFEIENSEECSAKQQEISAGPLVPYLKGLEALATRNGSNGHFVGDSVTIADIKTAGILAFLTSDFLPGVEASVLEEYPNLSQIKKAYESL